MANGMDEAGGLQEAAGQPALPHLPVPMETTSPQDSSGKTICPTRGPNKTSQSAASSSRSPRGSCAQAFPGGLFSSVWSPAATKSS